MDYYFLDGTTVCVCVCVCAQWKRMECRNPLITVPILMAPDALAPTTTALQLSNNS